MVLNNSALSDVTAIPSNPDCSCEIISESEQGSCRNGCGACCIAPSISSPIPAMPQGKPAGVRCIQLSHENRCEIYGMPDRPAICLSYQASATCGTSREHALRLFNELETMTRS